MPTHCSRRPLAHAVYAALVGIPLLSVFPPALPFAYGAEQEKVSEYRDYDIPAGALSSVLSRFASEAGLLLSADGALTSGLGSAGLKGRYSAREALTRLLSGSGLSFRFVDSDTITLERVTDSSAANAMTLDTITVLGSRQLNAPLSNVPVSITVIEREQIQEERAVSSRIEDILSRRAPGLNPTNTGVRKIRGRTAQVFINGVPVNEQLRASSGSDLNLLSPDQLAGAEISRGANSAYGFGSPGGIIALTTPRADSEALTLNTVVRESFNPQHVEGSHQTSVYQSAAQIAGQFDYHVGGVLAYDGAEYDPDGDLALGFDNSALLTNGKERMANIDSSLGYNLGDAGRLRLTTTLGYIDFLERYAIDPGAYRETYSTLVEDPASDESYRDSYTVDLVYENDKIMNSAVKLEMFSSRTYTEIYELFDGTTYRDEQTNRYMGFRSAIATPLDTLRKGTSVTYGLDFIRNNYFRPYYNDDTGVLDTYFAPDVTLESYAPYAQLEMPVGNVLLSGGARHEEYGGEVETATGGIIGGDIQDFDLTLFNLGAVYSLNDMADVYATFSQGAEITQLGRAARNASTAKEIDPQPAKSDQLEVGFRSNTEALTLATAAFYTESDLLSALQCDGINPCTPLREPREFWGIETMADWIASHQWRVGGAFTWQEGLRETETDKSHRIGSSDIPPILINTYADYKPSDRWKHRVQVNYRGKRDPFADSTEFDEGRVNDVVLVNVASTYYASFGDLSLGIENLFNEEYTSISAEAGNHEYLWLPEEGTRMSFTYAKKW